eukprot:SAG22_NODE_3875_length_1486_cov_1.255948_1_plen_200_part_10
MPQAFIFVRTQLDCDNLEEYLLAAGQPASAAAAGRGKGGGGKGGGGGGRRQKFGGKVEKGVEALYSCVVLHGGRRQNERQRNLEAFKDGDVRFLIATDVAARGLDISGDQPTDPPTRALTDACCLLQPPEQCHAHRRCLCVRPRPLILMCDLVPAVCLLVGGPGRLSRHAVLHQHDAARQGRGLHPPGRPRRPGRLARSV